MSVDLKVLVLSVVCDDLWYAKITWLNSLKFFFFAKNLAKDYVYIHVHVYSVQCLC